MIHRMFPKIQSSQPNVIGPVIVAILATIALDLIVIGLFIAGV